MNLKKYADTAYYKLDKLKGSEKYLTRLRNARAVLITNDRTFIGLKTAPENAANEEMQKW